MTRGIVYVAFGKEYEQLAAHTLAYSRKHTELPFHVITNVPEDTQSSIWKTIPNLTMAVVPDALSENRKYKIKLYEYTPYDKTLYLDIDSAIIRPGIEKIFDMLEDNDVVLARRFKWAPRDLIPEVYIRMFRLTHTRLPVDAWHGALFAFQRDNEEARRMMDLWWDYRNLAMDYRDLPPLVAAIANLRDRGLRVGITDPELFAFKPTPSTIVWHPQPGKPAAWLQQLGLPDWKPWNPANYRYTTWNCACENAELSEDKLIPKTACPKTAELCITAYTFGEYNEYLPLLAYSSLWSYPDTVVKLFVEDTLSDSVRAQFDYIRRQLSCNIDIVERYKLPVRHYTPQPRERGNQMGKIIRWLIPREEFAGYRYVYMADSDFIIVPEDPTLLDKHLMLCAQAAQPFTNPKRWNYPSRVSGLHFVETEPYFDAMDPVLKPYRIGAIPLPAMNNEEFLYRQLCAAGLSPAQRPSTREQFDALRPHPGYHLGMLRNYAEPQEYQAHWRSLEPRSRSILGSPMFQHLVHGITIPWIRTTVTRLTDWLATPIATPTASAKKQVVRPIYRIKQRRVRGAGPQVIPCFRTHAHV
jgi:hypothetical protein